MSFTVSMQPRGHYSSQSGSHGPTAGQEGNGRRWPFCCRCYSSAELTRLLASWSEVPKPRYYGLISYRVHAFKVGKAFLAH